MTSLFSSRLPIPDGLSAEKHQDELTAYRIIAAVGTAEHLSIQLAALVPLARSHQGTIIPVHVGEREAPPDWLSIPSEFDDVVQEPVVLVGLNSADLLLSFVRDQEPDLLSLVWRGQPSRGSYVLGTTLDPLIQNASCDVIVLRVTEDAASFSKRMANLKQILVPTGAGPNASLAISLGLDMAPQAEMSAVRIANPDLSPTATLSQWDLIRSVVEPFGQNERLHPHVVLSRGVIDGILQEAAEHELILIGATRESLVDRLLFGNLPQELAQRSQIPLFIVRRRDSASRAALRQARWGLLKLMPQLTLEERIEIYRRVRRQSRTDADFNTMIILSAVIASLGLLLNSSAVIIGAMIIAPLMSSLLGTSLSVVQGDQRMLRLSLRTLVQGVLLVFGVSLFLGWLVPGSNITDQMLGRTSPTLLDLGVALASGAAAAYATSRREAAGALSGVAIAVALVPPLATVGLLVGSGELTLGVQALLLFLTNLVAIVSAAVVIFLWMGFHPRSGDGQHGKTFRGGLLGTTVLLATVIIILAAIGINAVQKEVFANHVQTSLQSAISQTVPDSSIDSWKMEETADGLVISVIVKSESLDEASAQTARDMIAADLDIPVSLEITQLQVSHADF